ncbi:non-ribosomal peptide synthetase [Nocardioidaceae bacterium SCSIO 66511]|nr:non-ribosomal peptide synthetase [Nocardioidaceae bacterium SCSIO 66511]
MTTPGELVIPAAGPGTAGHTECPIATEMRVTTAVTLFEETVARHASAPAVVAPDRALTYRQLARASRRVARRLIKRGVGPESIVALIADRDSSDWLVGLLGVLQSGAAYLPLDPSYPAERVAFTIADAGPELLLHTGRPPWPVDIDHMAIAEASAPGVPDHVVADTERLSSLCPDNLAYLIYTSGSTGQPKGVAITHDGMDRLSSTQARRIGTGEGDQVLQWASPSFDAAFWDITLALLHGATLHLTTSEELLPGEPLANTLTDRRITHATLPPVALGALDPSGDVLRGGTVVSTGDTCTQGIVDAWAPGRTLINGYGPTETTVGATLSDPLHAGHRADIGTAFEDTRVDIVNDDLTAVDSSQVGQIRVGGHGIARAYLGRPRQTAARFRPDPNGNPGERVYLTGDLGLHRPDGHFEFVGRSDAQVKLRGFRIELGEIEATLAAHPAVSTAAVGVRQLEPGSDSIIAWVTLAAGAHLEDVQHDLSDKLPRYMLPARLIVLDKMPANAHGKIDRSRLPVSGDSLGRDDPSGSAEPSDHSLLSSDVSGDLEGIVRELFVSNLPAVDAVGSDDDFFSLGGDSIKFTRLISMLTKRAGVRLPLRDAFEAATPAGLTALADRRA